MSRRKRQTKSQSVPKQQPQKKQPEKKEVLTKKPKKYTKKSNEELARINRSKFQRIFLLSAERTQELWKFKVQGTTGSNYHAQVSTQVKCTCIDFRMKKKPCKHLYFIVTQVAQNQELLNYFKNDTKISKAAYKILDEQLTERLKSRMAGDIKDKKDIDLKDDTDCTICFCQMDKETEDLQDCHTCKKFFHQECLKVWKNHNPTCPLCRGALAGGQKDALGLLTTIKI